MKTADVMRLFGIFAVLVVAIVGTSMYFFSVASEPSDEEVQQIATVGERQEFCANNPALDGKIRIRDTLASTKAYLNGTVLVKNLETGAIVEKTVNSADGDFVTLSDLYECKNEKGYELYLKGEDPVNSNGVVVIEPEDLDSTPIESEFDASAFGHFKLKAYDNEERAKVEEIVSTSTDYTENMSATFGPFSGTAANDIDVTFDLRPINNGEAFGEAMYIIIDTEDESNLADWDETLTTVEYNGVALSEASGLSDNELRAMNGYEHIFALDEAIGVNADGSKRQESSLRVSFSPEADETSNDYDITIKIVARGDVESVKTDEILSNVGFSDDSSRTALFTAQTASLVVN